MPMKAGDICVQRGTMHAWVAKGSEPAVFAFVLIDAASTNNERSKSQCEWCNARRLQSGERASPEPKQAMNHKRYCRSAEEKTCEWRHQLPNRTKSPIAGEQGGRNPPFLNPPFLSHRC